jgi:hypothetical protein
MGLDQIRLETRRAIFLAESGRFWTDSSRFRMLKRHRICPESARISTDQLETELNQVDSICLEHL